MSLLEETLGKRLAYRHLHIIQRYLKTERTFVDSINVLMFELDDLNPIIYSLSDRYPSASYWVDSEKELSEKIMPKTHGHPLNINKFEYARIILTQLTNSIQAVIASELLEYAFIPISLQISEPLKFLIQYNAALITMRDYFQSIQPKLDLTKRAIENTIQRNEPYLMTKLAQLPAIRAKSIQELYDITIESLAPPQ